jgi:hypothetical protein
MNSEYASYFITVFRLDRTKDIGHTKTAMHCGPQNIFKV